MCVVSMIMDQWSPHVPRPAYPWPSTTQTSNPPVAEDRANEEVRELVDTLRQAIDAAERFDRLTGQPDCVDPEKATLMERVEELERRLASLEERVGE